MSYDWKKSRVFVKFLKLFCEATVKFSATKHVTLNVFVMKLITIHERIQAECARDDLFLNPVAENMKKKFIKYWGNLQNINLLLFVAIVLDPRFKLKVVE